MNFKLIVFVFAAISLSETGILAKSYPELATYVISGSRPSVGHISNAQYTPVYKRNGLQAQTSPKSDIAPNRMMPRAVPSGLLRRRNKNLHTETVYGFLDFTTTVGSTVMVFTPQSEPGKRAKSSPKSKTVAYITATPTLNTQSITMSRVTPKNIIEVTTPKKPATGLAKLLRDASLNKKVSRPLRHSKQELYSNKIIRKPSGGSTIVPITVEGKGGLLIAKTPTLQSSLQTPKEVVVSIRQTFPPVKIVSSTKFKYKDLNKKNFYKKFPKSESYQTTPKYRELSENKPTGLITTIKGTMISDGQTLITKTSVIGTYINGKYAQLLESTISSYENPSFNMVSPSPNQFKTVKTIISGTPTQYITPERTSSLPIESLFSSKPFRIPRLEVRQQNSKFSKRTGATPFHRDDYYYYDSKDQTYDEEYEDLIRSPSGIRPSFSPASTLKPTATAVYRRPDENAYKRRFKAGSTRNIPPSFLRNRQRVEKDNVERHSFRSNLKISKRPLAHKLLNSKKQKYVSPLTPVATNEEETVRVISTTPSNGPTNVWLEIKTLRSLHTYSVGANVNTRFLTYTKTTTHTLKPESSMEFAESVTSAYDQKLFEDILAKEKSEIATLPPIKINDKNLNDMLKTTTESFQTTETMYKTSVLPVKQISDMIYHTITQTYLITRIVSAIKTVPPVEAFEFIPGDSLNEFNSNLLAEGTENEAALLPGEKEYNENGEIRVLPPSGFKLPDSNLENLASGKFNPDVLDKQMNPQLTAALQMHQNKNPTTIASSKNEQPESNNAPTPTLSPQALQMAYMRLMNPYLFGNFHGALGNTPQLPVSSYPVVLTTDVTKTDTQVVRVIFNARPILKTLSSTKVVRTTITTYSTTKITTPPLLPGFAFPFGGQMPFPTG